MRRTNSGESGLEIRVEQRRGSLGGLSPTTVLDTTVAVDSPDDEERRGWPVNGSNVDHAFAQALEMRRPRMRVRVLVVVVSVAVSAVVYACLGEGQIELPDVRDSAAGGDSSVSPSLREHHMWSCHHELPWLAHNGRPPLHQPRSVAAPTQKWNGVSPVLPARVPWTRPPKAKQLRYWGSIGDPEDGNAWLRRFKARAEGKGWERVENRTDAELHWYYKEYPRFSKVRPWQRINKLVNEAWLNRKDLLVTHLNSRPNALENPLPFFPTSVVLSTPEGRAQFRALTDSGFHRPWFAKAGSVEQGLGIQLITNASERDALLSDPAALERNRVVAQRYIPDLLFYPGNLKFDLRVYFLAVSDPYMVLYRDGFMRVSFSTFDALDVSDKRKHLTNVGVQRTVAREEYLLQKDQAQQSFHALEEMLHAAFPEEPDPVNIVRCKIARAIAAAFDVDPQLFMETKREADFVQHKPAVDIDRAFTLMGADFLIDKNLDVWLTEFQSGPGMAMYTRDMEEAIGGMLNETVDVVLELREMDRAKAKSYWPLTTPHSWHAVKIGNKPTPIDACAYVGLPSTLQGFDFHAATETHAAKKPSKPRLPFL